MTEELVKFFERVDSDIKNLKANIDMLYTIKNSIVDGKVKIRKRVDELDNNIKILFARIEDIAEFCNRNWKHNRQPHKCPVCNGNGNDKGIESAHKDFKFYCEYASCHTCEGTGIVWG